MSVMVESVLTQIEQRARTNAQRTAVVSGSETLSYATLWSRVLVISAQIRQFGLRPGDAVGVALPRSVDWIAAMLAILRCQLVYVPINPALPIERQRAMASIASLRLVLTDAVEQWVEYQAAVAARDGRPDSDNVPALTCEHALAYLIFTSGTSGTPKAVAISHGNLAAHTAAMTSAFGLTEEDRVLQTCAIGFDISIEEVIPSLCAGASIVIGPDQIGMRRGGLSAYLAEQGITVANLPTALWSAWVDELTADSAIPDALRCVIVGGEACPLAKVQAWTAMASTARILALNGYGPTEATITTTVWRMRERASQALHVPIGGPVANTHAYVLDETVELSGSGELYLGGALVGQGYVGDPALTASVFLPNPYAPQAGARMYRTGDQVHWNLDGDLILTGRVDRQIKLRGYRIEPAEIERRLEIGGVRSAAVRLLNHAGQPLLVAYVAPVGYALDGARFMPASSIEASAYSSSLSMLPDYMRPAWYVLLPSLPLNANGKVDVRGLPDLPHDDEDRSDSVVSRQPANVVAECIRKCLHRDLPDWSVRFYEAGGDSIEAVRILAVLRQRGYDLDANALLNRPLCELSKHLMVIDSPSARADTGDGNLGRLSDQELGRLRASVPYWHEVDQVCPLTPVQLGMLYRTITGGAEGRYVEQVEGVLVDLDIARFQKTWQAVTDRHSILRATFSLVLVNKPLLMFRRGLALDWRTTDWTTLGASFDAVLTNWLASDRTRGFDLLEGPLQRFHLARLDERRWHFCWSYHHALLDGWSDIDVLDEVFDRYADVMPAAASVESPAGSFPDFVAWLQQQDQGRSVAFWRRHLSGLDPQRPWLIATSAVDAVAVCRKTSRAINEQTMTLIRSVAKRAGCTVNTALVAAWVTAVAALRPCRDVVIGSIAAIRPPELSADIVGPMLNLVPHRVSLPTEPILWSEWLRALQQAQNETFGHQHLGLDQIERPESGALFDTLVVFENYPAARHPEARALQSHTQTEFPLSLLVWPDVCTKIEIIVDSQRISSETLDRLWLGFEGALHGLASDAIVSTHPRISNTVTDDACLEVEI